MSEIRRRKIYAGYYDRYDRKPFYVVCEATDYDTGEVNIIMQEYSLVSTKPFVTISRDSFCEIVMLPNGRKVDKFTRNTNIPVSNYYIDGLKQKGLRGPSRRHEKIEEDEYCARHYQDSHTYFDYAKDIIDHYVIDRRRLDLCVKEKRLIGLFSMDDFKKMRADVLYFEKTLDGILSEYKEFFDERFRKKKSIRKYAADHDLNRGSVNYTQKKFYNAFAEQLDARDKAEDVCRLQKPAEKKKSK